LWLEGTNQAYHAHYSLEP